MYDYCVDDPVSFVDPDGLEFSPLPRGLRKRRDPARLAEQEKKDAEELARSQADTAVEQLRQNHVEALGKQYPKHSKEGLKHDLLIGQADKELQDGRHVLTEKGKPVPGADKHPISLEDKVARKIGKYSHMEPDREPREGIIGSVMDVVDRPGKVRKLTKTGKMALRGNQIATAASRVGNPDAAAPYYDGGEFELTQKHRDELTRRFYDPVNDLTGPELDAKMAKELGDKSPKAERRRLDKERAKKNKFKEIERFSDKMEDERLSRWKKSENYRAGLDDLWRPNWTPEGAAQMADTYDKLMLYHDTYGETLSEEERKNSLDHMKNNAYDHKLGRELPALEMLVKYGVGKTPLSFIPKQAAKVAAGKGAEELIPDMDIHTRTEDFRKRLEKERKKK